MNRRGFLQICSALAATAALPVPDFSLTEPGILIAEKPIILGAIRAVGMYEISRDDYIVRLDAFNPKRKEQFSVDFSVSGGEGTIRDRYLKNREVAEIVLRDRISYEGWLLSDMAELPIPRGYTPPAWMHA